MLGSPEKSLYNGRIIVALLVSYFFFALLGTRLWYLQCLKGDYYRSLSENNRTRTIRTLPPRGLVYDRESRILVKNRPSFDLAMMLEDAPDSDRLISDLSKILDRDSAELKENFNKTRFHRPFEPKKIITDISRDDLAKVKVHSHRLPGLIVTTTPTRDYPRGELAAHFLGHVREITSEQLKQDESKIYRPGDILGQAGLEKQWEELLKGEPGYVRLEVDAKGNRKSELEIEDNIHGSDIYLNIDLDLQEVAEEELGDRKGAIVALDPRNGEVLALVSSPGFDANIFSGKMQEDVWRGISSDKRKPLNNRAISSRYPPGSTFKLFVAVAALSEKAVSTKKEYDCPGFFYFAGRKYHCHKRTGHGKVNLRRAIRVSCNAFFYQVGQLLGIESISRVGEYFGFGAKPELALPRVGEGILPSKAWKLRRFAERWYPGDTLPVSIGQGYLVVTPLQLAVAVSALVNGGTVYAPKLVNRIVRYPEVETEEFESEIVKQVPLDKRYLELIKDMAMEVVHHEEGTGSRAKIEGVEIGGKTGTAQVAALGSAEDKEELKDHAWFVSYAPVKEPSIVLSIIVENSGHGGVAAAPISKKIMQKYFLKTGDIKSEEEEPSEDL